ncbi:MAG: hypothetical protein M0T74_14365 [Desulfitobacterium hafniense]|nr:hypothetical protein [Desulfitobacterium hafniense]
MSDLDFFLTAALFSILGYVLCYLTLSSKKKSKKDLSSLKASEEESFLT